MSDDKPPIDEVSFIGRAHDELMKATTYEQRAYLTLAKEASPVVVRLLTDIMQKHRVLNAEGARDDIAAFLNAWTEWAANTSTAIASTLCGTGSDREQEFRNDLLRLMSRSFTEWIEGAIREESVERIFAEGEARAAKPDNAN